ncbi:MAG: glycosyl hydrolase, partial [Flavobacteriaceae bacterium]
PKTAYRYIPRPGIYGQGDNTYKAKNPPFGASFTYYLPKKLISAKEGRTKGEKELTKQNTSIPFPGWDALGKEKSEEAPGLILMITDQNGQVVNTIVASNKKGFNRVSWNLSHANRSGIPLKAPKPRGDEEFFTSPYMATPGTYQATLYKKVQGTLTQLADPVSFQVKQLRDGALPSKPANEIDAFRTAFQDFQQKLMSTNTVLKKSIATVNAMKRAHNEATRPSTTLYTKIEDTRKQLLALDEAMNGNPAKNEVGERNVPAPGDGSFIGYVALGNTYGPTGNHHKAFNRAKTQLLDITAQLRKVTEDVLPSLEAKLQEAGAPWIEGQGLIKN